MRLTDWHRKLAASIAAAGPAIPMVEIRATGNNLAAQNDEAELHPFRESDFEPAGAVLDLDAIRAAGL